MIEDFPDLNCDVEHSVLTKMEQQDIHRVIDQLNTEERMIIYGIFFENKMQTQMAEIMGISRQVLAYKLKTILNKMREMKCIERSLSICKCMVIISKNRRCIFSKNRF